MKTDSDHHLFENENSDNPFNLNSTALEKIDGVCLEFERVWKTGSRPNLDAHLSLVDAEVRMALLRELILLDVDYRRSRGESPSRADYVDCLPPTGVVFVDTIFDPSAQANMSTHRGTRHLSLATSANKDSSGELPEFLGRYRVMELIGEGGFGVVYRAHDSQLKRDVAIKVPHARLDGHVQAGKLFRNEAQTVARLRHPAIVPVFDVHFDPDRLSSCFVVSQFMEGDNLALHADGRPIPAHQAATIVARIAEALHYAHEQGLVHRDVKLSNILRDGNGEVFIADFGLAVGQEHIAAGEGFAGTPTSMSPEQARGDAGSVDRRSDVYGLGAVLYELLTGRRPFTEPGLESLLEQIQATAPQPPRELNDGVPVELERICLKALAKKPTDRFSSAREMAAELRSCQSTPTTGRGYSRWLPAAVLLLTFSVFLIRQKFATPVSTASTTAEIRSLAILPFGSTGERDNDDYDEMGMADCLNSRLGRLRQIVVRPTRSIKDLSESSGDARQLGRRLKVDAVLKGSVHQTRTGTQTNVQLVQVTDGKILWEESFDHNVVDVLEIQDTISVEVANTLVAQLPSDEKIRVERRPTDSQVAHEAYVKGRYHWNQRSNGGSLSIGKAIRHFKAAIDADPLFAQAWSGLAESYALSNAWSSAMDEQALPRARAAALKALEIDNDLHDAHATLALVLFYHDWNWEESEKEFRRAIELNPSYATTHQWFGETLYFRSRFDESIKELKRAAELDPLSEVIASLQGTPHLFRRDYESAQREYQRALKVYPKSVLAFWGMAVLSECEGQAEKALSYYQRTGQRYGQAYMMARLGRAEEAKKIRQKCIDNEPFPTHPFNIALIDIGLGDFDSAFHWLEKGKEIRDERLVWLKVDPRLDPLRDDPRFVKLLNDVGWIEQAGDAPPSQ